MMLVDLQKHLMIAAFDNLSIFHSRTGTGHPGELLSLEVFKKHVNVALEDTV